MVEVFAAAATSETTSSAVGTPEALAMLSLCFRPTQNLVVKRNLACSGWDAPASVE